MPGQARTLNLQAAKSATAPASGIVQISLGPEDQPGPANWDVDSVLWQTTRPGVAPVPRLQIFQDIVDPSQGQVNSYDGSFGQAVGSLTISRGSRLIAIWTGCQAGDVCTMTVTGTKR